MTIRWQRPRREARYRFVTLGVALTVATFHLSLLKGHEKLAPPKGHRNARSTAPESHSRDRRDDSRNAAEEQGAEQLHGGQDPACRIAGRPGRAASCTSARHRPNARVRTGPQRPVA